MTVRSARKQFWNVVALLLTVLMAFPVFWMISTAFKPDDQIFALTPTWIPLHPTLRHFDDAIHKPFFWADVKNSLIVVARDGRDRDDARVPRGGGAREVPVLGQGHLHPAIIGIQMLPGAGLVIPLYVVLAKYHQVNVLSGVIITYLTFILPFSVYTLRGFILGIPKDLEEAAMVDGSTRLGAFIKILLPLVAPGLVATSVFAFIVVWNEYLFARTLLNDASKQTLTVWLSYFLGTSRNTDWGALMAASTLTAIPVVIFFLIIQRRIAFGLTSGAVRG